MVKINESQLDEQFAYCVYWSFEKQYKQLKTDWNSIEAVYNKSLRKTVKHFKYS